MFDFSNLSEDLSGFRALIEAADATLSAPYAIETKVDRYYSAIRGLEGASLELRRRMREMQALRDSLKRRVIRMQRELVDDMRCRRRVWLAGVETAAVLHQRARVLITEPFADPTPHFPALGRYIRASFAWDKPRLLVGVNDGDPVAREIAAVEPGHFVQFSTRRMLAV